MARRDSLMTLLLGTIAFAGVVRAASCKYTPPRRVLHDDDSTTTTTATTTTAATTTTIASAAACDGKGTLRAHFYDVAQGLAILIELPDGRRIMVDAGDSATRAGCEGVCAKSEEHLLATLKRDAPDGSIDGLWITHPHSDHEGGASALLDAFDVRWLADNGRDLTKPVPEHAHKAAARRGTAIHSIAPPTFDASFLRGAWPESILNVRAVVPDRWHPDCREDENECSIGLRVDYCQSSILIVGDAEKSEETRLETFGPATLLQVGHHGSDTSTSEAFLERVQPKYAVISAGKPDEGLNATYCHPRAATIDRLDRHLGGKRDAKIRAFDGKAHCKAGLEAHWRDVASSDRIWATERDGDVVLSTRGDGVFARE